MTTTPLTTLAPHVKLTAIDGETLDLAGLEQVKCRLNVGAADELTIELPAYDNERRWRVDMPLWQPGSLLTLHLGYNGEVAPVQTFEIAEVNSEYDDDNDRMVVFAISDLSRANHFLDARVVTGTDDAMVRKICQHFGWTPVLGRPITGDKNLTKARGVSDLEVLKIIAAQHDLGGPRVEGGRLIMPKPAVTTRPLYLRGDYNPAMAGEALKFKATRHTAHFGKELSIVSWDPSVGTWVEIRMDLNKKGGEPEVTYRGPPKHNPLHQDPRTDGLVVSISDGRIQQDRRDVIITHRYETSLTAEELGRRWYRLRELTSRWAEADLDGSLAIRPYEAIEIGGRVSAIDKGLWLPITVTHIIDEKGWITNANLVRVVSDPTLSLGRATKVIPPKKKRASRKGE